MTAPNLTELLDAAGLHARNVLVDKQLSELVPLFHLVDAEGQGYIVAAPFEGNTPAEAIASKDAVAATVRRIAAEHKAVAYSFMSEAWMIVRQNNWDERVSTPPADSADRIEVVIATAQSRTGYDSRRWLIKRNKRGKCIDLVLDVMEGETPKPSGRFDGLLG